MEDAAHQLVLQAQSGDRSAFDTLYSMHQGRIIGYCMRLLGNKEHGEEVAQEVMVKAWVHLNNYRFESPFSNWLIHIATNECRNRYRTADGKGERYNPSLDQPAALAVVQARLPASEIEAGALRTVYHQHLLHTIRQIAKTTKPPWDALDWSIFHLLYEQNISQAREVARCLGMSEDTVKYRIYKRIKVVFARVRAILEAEEATAAALQQVTL